MRYLCYSKKKLYIKISYMLPLLKSYYNVFPCAFPVYYVAQQTKLDHCLQYKTSKLAHLNYMFLMKNRVNIYMHRCSQQHLKGFSWRIFSVNKIIAIRIKTTEMYIFKLLLCGEQIVGTRQVQSFMPLNVFRYDVQNFFAHFGEISNTLRSISLNNTY